MFSELSMNERLAWSLGTFALVSVVVMVFIWTSNSREARKECLQAGGDWGFSGACVLSSKYKE